MSNNIFYYDLTNKEPTKISPSAKCQRAGNVRLPRQDDFRNFCMNDEAEKVCQKLEEKIKKGTTN